MKLYKVYKGGNLLGTYTAETTHHAINKALTDHGGNIAEYYAELTRL